MQKLFSSMIGVVLAIAAARVVVVHIAAGDTRSMGIAAAVVLAIALYVVVRSGLARAAFRVLLAGAAWRIIRRR